MKQAAARRAAARRRRKAVLGVVAAVAVVGLIIAMALTWGGSDGARKESGPTGGNSALAAKPAVGPGTGDLTKLTVTTLIEGTGSPVKAGQRLSVNYVGVSYKTGKEFDSSWSQSQPFPFTIGTGAVIKGWDDGLIGVKVGSRVQLDIPSELAYGDAGDPSGPLRFVVDVLSAT